MQVKEGEEDEGKQGVHRSKVKSRDMQVLGCVIKLRLPQYTVNAVMDMYLRAGQYRGAYLRSGKLVEKPVDEREAVLEYCRKTKDYTQVAAKRGLALLYDPGCSRRQAVHQDVLWG